MNGKILRRGALCKCGERMEWFEGSKKALRCVKCNRDKRSDEAKKKGGK